MRNGEESRAERHDALAGRGFTFDELRRRIMRFDDEPFIGEHRFEFCYAQQAADVQYLRLDDKLPRSRRGAARPEQQRDNQQALGHENTGRSAVTVMDDW